MRAGCTRGVMKLQEKEEREKIRRRESDRERGFDQEKGRGDEQVDYPPVGKKESEEKEEGKEMKKNEKFKIKDWVEDIADKKEVSEVEKKCRMLKRHQSDVMKIH